jgi:hypothetical protein
MKILFLLNLSNTNMKQLTISMFIGICLLCSCNSSDRKIQLFNEEASLPAAFHLNQPGLKMMATIINKEQGTMSVLYANPLAIVNAAKGNSGPIPGEIMALVTWKQKADKSWFGAKVPGRLQFVELLKTTGKSMAYEKYTGKSLSADPDTAGRQERINYILTLQPSVMP